MSARRMLLIVSFCTYLAWAWGTRVTSELGAAPLGDMGHNSTACSRSGGDGTPNGSTG